MSVVQYNTLKFVFLLILKHQVTPYTPPSGSNCTDPKYMGTAVVGGVNCQYWEIVCYAAPSGNTTTDMYYNGNTPVQVCLSDEYRTIILFSLQ